VFKHSIIHFVDNKWLLVDINPHLFKETQPIILLYRINITYLISGQAVKLIFQIFFILLDEDGDQQ